MLQTEAHPIDTSIDLKYDCNEWSLRRKALQLANLRQKQTHSVQTDNSNFRRDQQTQVYKPKDGATQTKVDAATSVPKPQTYLKVRRRDPFD